MRLGRSVALPFCPLIAGEPSAVASDWNEPPELEAQDDEFSPFRTPDDVGRRGRSKILTTLVIVIVVAALAAAFWFLAPPEWKARLGLAGAGASPLALVTTHMDRQRLESGNELLTVTGRVNRKPGWNICIRKPEFDWASSARSGRKRISRQASKSSLVSASGKAGPAS